MQKKDLSILEENIGYRFNNRALLEEALTHSSYANELKSKKKDAVCNERLEFLGDSVLSTVTSEYLFAKYDRLPEGDLSHIRASLVQSQSLASYARKIELGSFLLLGRGEENISGRGQQSILENAFEALVAAIYLDSGAKGLDNARAFVLPFIKDSIEKNDVKLGTLDPKTELQQLTTRADGILPSYFTVGEMGPDHNKTFEVEARLGSNVIGRGTGRSKREAEQNAAKEALKLFGVDND
ncbi:MAG: ribonuclease III [Clostridia bacterium]|nr:ribonuclease III [Clostridia bacterium]